MKRWICILLCLTACVTVRADELATGIKAWEQRDFATAQTIFTKLANAGNAEAQLLLGEMYGYGEGVPEDAAQAERWLSQARAGGHKDAAESLANVRQRAARKADIARVIESGAAPQSLAQFGCAMPAFPEVSTTQKEVKAVNAMAKDWRSCYERYGAYLKALPASAGALPPDVARLMNLGELERARAGGEQAHARAAAAANEQAGAFGRASDQWYERTSAYAKNMEKITREQSEQRMREVQATATMGKAFSDSLKGR